MKLLFDQNLSPKLVGRLADLFPGSSHVRSEGLAEASDEEVWENARLNGYAIVTKDADFNDLSVMNGCPPRGLSGCSSGTALRGGCRRCCARATRT